MNWISVCEWVCYWTLFSILLVQLLLPALVPHCFHYFNFKINFGIQLMASHPLCFHVCWIRLSSYTHTRTHTTYWGFFSLKIGSVRKISICNVGSSNSKYNIALHLVRFPLTFLIKFHNFPVGIIVGCIHSIWSFIHL